MCHYVVKGVIIVTPRANICILFILLYFQIVKSVCLAKLTELLTDQIFNVLVLYCLLRNMTNHADSAGMTHISRIIECAIVSTILFLILAIVSGLGCITIKHIFIYSISKFCKIEQLPSLLCQRLVVQIEDSAIGLSLWVLKLRRSIFDRFYSVANRTHCYNYYLNLNYNLYHMISIIIYIFELQINI